MLTKNLMRHVGLLREKSNNPLCQGVPHRRVLLQIQGHVKRTEWLQNSFASGEEPGRGRNSLLIILLDANLNQDFIRV